MSRNPPYFPTGTRVARPPLTTTIRCICFSPCFGVVWTGNRIQAQVVPLAGVGGGGVSWRRRRRGRGPGPEPWAGRRPGRRRRRPPAAGVPVWGHPVQPDGPRRPLPVPRAHEAARGPHHPPGGCGTPNLFPPRSPAHAHPSESQVWGGGSQSWRTARSSAPNGPITDRSCDRSLSSRNPVAARSVGGDGAEGSALLRIKGH